MDSWGNLKLRRVSLIIASRFRAVMSDETLGGVYPGLLFCLVVGFALAVEYVPAI